MAWRILTNPGGLFLILLFWIALQVRKSLMVRITENIKTRKRCFHLVLCLEVSSLVQHLRFLRLVSRELVLKIVSFYEDSPPANKAKYIVYLYLRISQVVLIWRRKLKKSFQTTLDLDGSFPLLAHNWPINSAHPIRNKKTWQTCFIGWKSPRKKKISLSVTLMSSEQITIFTAPFLMKHVSLKLYELCP